MCHRGNTFGVQLKLQVAVVIACLLLHASQARQVGSRKLLQAPGTIAYQLAILKANYKRTLDNLNSAKASADQQAEDTYSTDLQAIIDDPTSTKADLKRAKKDRKRRLKETKILVKATKRQATIQYKQDKKDIKNGLAR